MAKAFMNLLDKAKVSFSVLENEAPSGTFLGDLIGFVEETRKQAKTCADQINNSPAKTVIVLDPWEAATMIQRYAEWGFPIKAQLKTAPSFIEGLVKQGKLKPAPDKQAAKKGGVVSYHDSSRLARDLEIHDAPRFLLESMGYTLKEMFQNRRLAKCCGSSLLKAYAPELALLTAEGRWEDFLRTGAETLVTACPESYEVLSEKIPEGKNLIDLFELLDAAS
jgi:Fe-S oxidoreductase